MKTFLFFWIMACFISCSENKKKPVDVIVSSAKAYNDTFMVDLGYQMSVRDRKRYIPGGIELDTIEKSFKNGRIAYRIEIPRLPENDLKHVDETLRKNIKKAATRFLTDNVDDKDKEYNKLLKNGEIGMSVIMIYKDQKIINYCFELEYYDNILVRPYHEYYSITYDLTKNIIISTANFFNTKATKDSMELSKYILRGLDSPIKSELNFDEMDFSMDDSVIYFFTDQYQLGIPVNYSCGIKKKYLVDYIKNEYK